MTAERLAQIIMDIDPDAAITPSGIELTIEDIPVLVVMAPAADRMRAMVPIASVEDVTPEEMSRMMQANFDTALDARYAVAKDRVLGVFIHPLGALEREQFLSAIAQTVNLARTYGRCIQAVRRCLAEAIQMTSIKGWLMIFLTAVRTSKGACDGPRGLVDQGAGSR